jgi:protein O-GlcNAc transferase
MFQYHDRNKFQVVAYAYDWPDQDDMWTKKVTTQVDDFINLSNYDHKNAASKIYADQVDILVDLTGYTQGSRMEICALRPAPIQISYLGFLGSSGSDFFDYFVTDKVLTPPSMADFFTEEFIYMPDCFQVNSPQKIGKESVSRLSQKLPPSQFVFCSGVGPNKVGKGIFTVWMNILKQVPGSVLWVRHENELAAENMRNEAKIQEVDPTRLIFAEVLFKDLHLKRLQFADLALDTPGVNGGTTNSDFLWAGVPVVTIQGSHTLSRMGASLLTAVGMPELITHTLDEYQDLAMKLATDKKIMKTIKAKLSKNRLKSPLFRTQLFVRNLEKAYLQAWKGLLAGKPPRQIQVKSNEK